MTNVTMTTSMGVVAIELDEKNAPATVKNFLSYVDDKFYDGTVFHRVIPGFMIQGGGFGEDLQRKGTKPPVKNEAANGLKNTTGTIAMARTSDPDSATAQFFINVKDNVSLDHQAPSPMGMGYCVFGKVTSGLDVVKKIEAVATGMKNGMKDVPTNTVRIESIRRS
jgi:cyclophilin family peptidyl-prolyl cis-trans isomerase